MPVAQQGIPDAQWDIMLAELDGHFLQSRCWQGVQAQLDHEITHAYGDGWAWAAHLRELRGVRYLYAPYGPTARSPVAAGAAIGTLHAAASALRCDFVRFEPCGAAAAPAVEHLGGRRVAPVQPENSWVLPLDVDDDTLRRGLTKGHRSSINGAERRGLSFRRSRLPGDISHLLRLLHLTSARGDFALHPDGYYHALATELMPKDSACLYLAEHEGEVVAAALGFDFNGCRSYAHAGADPATARRLGAAAPLVWAMIEDARASGASRFDFWGVLPDDAPLDHPWRGFSQFKRAFGGRPVRHQGCFELAVRPLRYRAYRLAKAVMR